MKRTFKYRIYANNQTITKAENWLRLCCNLYNCALEERIDSWKKLRIPLSLYNQINELPNLRKIFSDYKGVDSQSLRTPLRILDNSFKAFFRRMRSGEKPGFPRFKSISRFNSITLERAGWHLDGRYLWIHKIGRFKMNLSRPIEGKIKTITIKRTPTNKWYVCFSCDEVPEKILPQSDKVVGLDMGVKSYLTDSEGNHIENPKWLRHTQRMLRVKQRKLARAIKGSNRRKESRLQVAKLHEKITNQRLDWQHKLANNYIKNYGIIVIEDLAISNMVRNHCLARSISDCAWGNFFQLLKYKAEEAGREIVESYRFKPTSKTCSSCGAINKTLKLSDREWVCQVCGTLHDRDENAAKNIKESGFEQNLQTLTQASASAIRSL
jgi:putative transposase